MTNASQANESGKDEALLRIGEAAQRLGVSERALRYYEELGLVMPAHHSPGGNRRYGRHELARVRRIRELQDLMGLNLDEIRAVLLSEDQLEELRAQWHRSRDKTERRRILEEAIALLCPMRDRVEAKHARLSAFLEELDQRIGYYGELLADADTSAHAASP
jgi:DNA-binding transcriptional MerR regulator